jgi:beta-1,2-mannobiose phosphorylase / 1,2-beta-oligomannan phosphorylase
MRINVTRKDIKFLPDSSRVIARLLYTSDERSKNIIRKVLDMPDSEVNNTLSQVLRDYSKRHRNISVIFENNFNKISKLFDDLNINHNKISAARKALIGSYFTMEYSIESAALFNPSVIEDPYQSRLARGEKRVIFSFRATGEGHISSIVFLSAVIDKNSNLKIEPMGKMLAEAERIKRHIYKKKSFVRILDEMSDLECKTFAMLVLEKLGDKFTYGELKKIIVGIRKSEQLSTDKELIINQMMWLAKSHYEIDFRSTQPFRSALFFLFPKRKETALKTHVLLNSPMMTARLLIMPLILPTMELPFCQNY